MTVQYPRQRVEELLLDAPLPACVRIFPSKHRATPTGVGPGDSRFATSTEAHRVLYVAPSFATAFVEVVVRDRFTRHRGDRSVHWAEIRNLVYALVSSRGADMRWLDLRADGCVRLGAPTDAVHARHHRAGQALARTIHAGHPDVDGILFPGRLTGSDVYAVFDRALLRVEAGVAGPLQDHPDLPAALRRYELWIDRRRS